MACWLHGLFVSVCIIYMYIAMHVILSSENAL